MALKQVKTRCLVLTDGKFLQDKTLYVSQLSISNQPVKCLGKKISFAVSDKDQMEVISSAASKGLALINESLHRGVHKVWILQQLLVPRLRWPLLTYEIPILAVLRLEQKMACYIRKWLKLHNPVTNICLYSSVSPCPLPIKSLTSVMKSAKINGHFLFHESSDICLSGTSIDLRSNWKVSDAVRQAVGYHQSNRASSDQIQLLKFLPQGITHMENCFH